MTLFELLLSLAVLGAFMGVLVTVSETLRANNAQAQTRHTLQILHEALHGYHRDTAQWPPGPTATAIQALTEHVESRGLLENLVHRGEDGLPEVRDGYGRSIQYVPPNASNDGRPDFASAGGDGILGDPASRNAAQRGAAADNLFASDLQMRGP